MSNKRKIDSVNINQKLRKIEKQIMSDIETGGNPEKLFDEQEQLEKLLIVKKVEWKERMEKLEKESDELFKTAMSLKESAGETEEEKNIRISTLESIISRKDQINDILSSLENKINGY